MAITPELRAEILRLYQTELWRIGTIATQLHVHRDTVRRVLETANVMRPAQSLRASQADPYLPFIRETLTQFPTLTASRLHAMVKSRGFEGGGDYFRRIVARHRPRPYAEAYLSYSNRHADLLFELISRRYEQKSKVVTANRAFKEWGEVFPNAACVVSLVDRLVHRCEVVAIEGDSYRRKEALERVAQKAALRSKTRSQGEEVVTSRQPRKTTVPVLSQRWDCPPQSSVPAHWSPEQATAVFEFLDVLREEIWGRYGLQIQQVLRNDRMTTHPFEETDIDESLDTF